MTIFFKSSSCKALNYTKKNLVSLGIITLRHSLPQEKLSVKKTISQQFDCNISSKIVGTTRLKRKFQYFNFLVLAKNIFK